MEWSELLTTMNSRDKKKIKSALEAIPKIGSTEYIGSRFEANEDLVHLIYIAIRCGEEIGIIRCLIEAEIRRGGPIDANLLFEACAHNFNPLLWQYLLSLKLPLNIAALKRITWGLEFKDSDLFDPQTAILRIRGITNKCDCSSCNHHW